MSRGESSCGESRRDIHLTGDLIGLSPLVYLKSGTKALDGVAVAASSPDEDMAPLTELQMRRRDANRSLECGVHAVG